MFGKKKADVLVVGAGPVGLFTALALARQGARVMIVDKEWRTGAHSYALALHPQSLALLDQLELSDDILAQALPVKSLGLYDGQQRRSQLQLAGQYPLAVMSQDVLERTLEAALQRAGATVLWNHAVSRITPTDKGVEASVDKLVKDSVGYGIARTEWMVAKTYEVEAQYVVGTDGHRSLTRRSLGIDFAQTGPPSHFAVFECALDRDAEPELKLNLGATTTDVLWPLPKQHCRWSFQLTDFNAPEHSRTKNRLPVEIGGVRFPVLDEQHLQDFLAQRAPWFEAVIEGIAWRIVVRFEQRMATSFGQGRVWLAGDSGHLTGPAGMQSMNVGLREARQLCDIIQDGLAGQNVDDQFAQYNRQRAEEWQQLLGLERRLEPTADTDPWVADVAERLVPCLPSSGEDLAAMAGQLTLNLPAKTATR